MKMNRVIYALCFILIFTQCKNTIKEENVEIHTEEGTEIVDSSIVNIEDKDDQESISIIDTNSYSFWVGEFVPNYENSSDEKHIYADEGLYWSRENKISISIDKIMNDSVIGHSIVAGNDRPFHGKLTKEDDIMSFNVKEPGNDKYDGEFTFQIKNNTLTGTWTAYKKINISERKYELEKKTFKYNPNQMLNKDNRGYANWEKYISESESYVEDEGTEYEEVYEWISKEFATTTDKIYEINASNKLLTKEDVENLTNSDLVVLRNTIYARHGYSFKNRPLRVFFDNQDWYIPVYADIKKEFSDIEKKNIQLLLRYEKNAKEYYDSFGRG